MTDFPLSRRAFLRTAALTAAGAALGAPAGAVRGPRSSYGPFKMGIQTYTLRAFPLAGALAKVNELGLHYAEIWNDQMPVTDDPSRLADYHQLLQKYSLQAPTYGVIGFGANREANRRIFQFARAMGIRILSANPSPDSFASLNDLVREFDIRIAIHNHGPGSRYSKIQEVLDAIHGRDRRIGACVDTGHYLHSGEDPVDAVRRFGRRTYGVHLKDVKQDGQFTELGKGNLQLVPLLDTLNDLRYDGLLSLEYEEHADNVMPYVEECLAATRAAVAQLAAQRKSPPRSLEPGY